MGIESSAKELAPSNLRTAEIRSEKFSEGRRRKFFRVVVKHAYPKDTARHIRRLTKQKYGERTIYDWIAGRSEAPVSVYIKIMAQILED